MKNINSKALEKIGILSIIFISIISWIISFNKGLNTVYNDAMSHLDVSRLVVDNLTPGLTQLGSVWLPLNHVLSLPFIWNNWLWHSGLAGAIVSMFSYILSSIFIYLIVKNLTKSVFASFVSSLAFVINVNILYLQTTPLTEPLYLLTFIASCYFFLKYILTENTKYMLPLGMFSALQLLTRYDGWFVVFVEAILFLFFFIFIKKEKIKEIIGKFTLFAFPIISAAILWFLWNLLIYGDALYFMLGPYSAHAQQATIESKSGLITKHNLFESVKAYLFTINDNIGIIVCVLAIIGVIIFFLNKKDKITISRKALIVALLLSPVVFNIIALYLGFSILNIPELQWNPSGGINGFWFNVRYGILALPFISVFAGFLISYKKYFLPAVFLLIILQNLILFINTPITIIDGEYGSSAFESYDTANYLSTHVHSDEKILMSTSQFNAVAYKSNLNLSSFIHEGTNYIWKTSLNNPEEHAQWIVMGNGNYGDPVYKTLEIDQQGRFKLFYNLVYSGAHANVYKKKTIDELYVQKNKENLTLASANYTIKGVNSYDLAYRSQNEIKQTFDDLSKIGINTVRFWAFGDGIDYGFQPQAGIINESMFEKMDYVVAQAKIYNIRLIPTFVNNWDEYGGKDQYIKWVGKDSSHQDLFFTDNSIKNLYKNYLNKILTRRNTITGNIYSEDPSILSWDLINEPRNSSNINLLNNSANNEDNIKSWINEMTSYIKSHDSNHLVTVGLDQSFGSNQVNHIQNLCSTSIDYCSIHLYPDNYSISLDKQEKINKTISDLTVYSDFAKKMSMPIVLEEIGLAKDYISKISAQNIIDIKNIVNKAEQLNYSGVIIWNWSESTDTTYGFSPLGDQNGEYDAKDLREIFLNNK